MTLIFQSVWDNITESESDTSHSHSFSSLTATPTTLAGYGITDAVASNDSRLTDARTPSAHNQAWSTITATPTTLSGYGITDSVASNDSRLSDARTPSAHNQAWSTITATPTTATGYGLVLVASDIPNLDWSKITTGVPSTFTPSAHNQAWSTITATPTTLAGYGITDAVASNDSRLTDARTPTSHNQAWSTITATPTTLAGYGITDATTLPSQTGNSGKYLSTDGSALSWASVSGGGLTNLIESLATSSPNNTVNSVVLKVSNSIGTTNVDFILSPKGSGAISLQLADSTTTGGNKRGAYAVDLQTSRNDAAQVASGSNSVVIGGSRNQASDDYTTIVGGYYNTASVGYATVVGGFLNTASGGYAAVLGGTSNIASAYGSWIPGGSSGRTYLRFQGAHSAGYFGGSGDAQHSWVVVSKSTTNETQAEMTIEGGSPSSTSRLILPDNKSWFVTLKVSARTNSTGNVAASFERLFLINRRDGAAQTAIVGSVDTIGTDKNSESWGLTIQADTTNGSLQILVTGASATNIRWVGVLDLVEVGYAG